MLITYGTAGSLSGGNSKDLVLLHIGSTNASISCVRPRSKCSFLTNYRASELPICRKDLAWARELLSQSSVKIRGSESAGAIRRTMLCTGYSYQAIWSNRWFLHAADDKASSTVSARLIAIKGWNSFRCDVCTKGRVLSPRKANVQQIQRDITFGISASCSWHVMICFMQCRHACFLSLAVNKQTVFALLLEERGNPGGR